MSKTPQQRTGSQGENAACDFLIKKGYNIIARNYRHKRAEIDIIAQHKNTLIFVEVKTRSNTKFGMPEDFVNSIKEELFFEASQKYMEDKGWKGDIRFDIIAIVKEKHILQIEHLEDVFY